MNLPENPTPEQLKATFALTIESIYQDGVEEILEGPTLEGKTIRGKFRDGAKIFDVAIANGQIEFKPSADSDPAAFEDGAEFAEGEEVGDLDAIALSLNAKAAPPIEDWLGTIQQRLSEGEGDLASFAEELESLYPDLDSVSFAATMGQAMSLSRLIGGNDDQQLQGD